MATGRVIDLTLAINNQGSSYRGSFTNWTALTTAIPIANIGDLAVVENSEGASWLPWTLGGAYYPQGTYYFDGSKWDSNVELIAQELQLINDSITSIFGSESIHVKSYSADTSTNYRGASNVKFIWDGTFFNNGITHSASVNNTRFTIDTAGKYYISAMISLIGDGNSIREQFTVRLFVNGVALSEESSAYLRDTAGDRESTGTLTTALELSVGDYVEVTVSSNSGTGTTYAIANASTFVMHKLGGLTTTANNVVMITEPIQIAFADSPYIASFGQDIEVDCTAGNVVITFPSAIGSNGRLIAVTKVDSSINTITNTPFGVETINGALNDVISIQWTSNQYKSNNTNLTKR